MPRIRPKMLSVVTVPTGGWDFDFKVSSAATLDTDLTATVAAGDYFLADDQQSDDLLFELATKIQAQVTATWGTNAYVHSWIDSDYKVNIAFHGSQFVDSAGHENDVEINWTTSASGLAIALGFNASADDTSTSTDYPLFTADYRHGYGWYASGDYQLETFARELMRTTRTEQHVAMSGRVFTRNIASYGEDAVGFRMLPERLTFSNDKAYGTFPPYPADMNEPLECFWLSVRGGQRFRVYRNTLMGTGDFAETGTASSVGGNDVGDSSKTFGTDPQEFKNYAVYGPDRSLTRTMPVKGLISSHSPTVLSTSNNMPDGQDFMAVGDTYYVFDHRYRTYTLAPDSNVWAPRSDSQDNFWSESFNLRGYVP